MLTLTGERVYVRQMTEADATEQYASWLNDPEVNKYLATKSATPEELRDYITKKNTQEDALLFGIFLKQDNAHIGTVKLEPINLVAKWATIGIMIGEKQQWGKGFASEAMQLVINYCFQKLHLQEVRLGVLAQNSQALHTYAKLGFVEVKREIQSVVYPNGVFDQVTMILKNHA